MLVEQQPCSGFECENEDQNRVAQKGQIKSCGTASAVSYQLAD